MIYPEPMIVGTDAKTPDIRREIVKEMKSSGAVAVADHICVAITPSSDQKMRAVRPIKLASGTRRKGPPSKPATAAEME